MKHVTNTGIIWESGAMNGGWCTRYDTYSKKPWKNDKICCNMVTHPVEPYCKMPWNHSATRLEGIFGPWPRQQRKETWAKYSSGNTSVSQCSMSTSQYHPKPFKFKIPNSLIKQSKWILNKAWQCWTHSMSLIRTSTRHSMTLGKPDTKDRSAVM